MPNDSFVVSKETVKITSLSLGSFEESKSILILHSSRGAHSILPSSPDKTSSPSALSTHVQLKSERFVKRNLFLSLNSPFEASTAVIPMFW